MLPTTDLLLIGLGLALGFGFTPVAIRYASAWGLLDLPEGSLKIHTHPTPRSGGVALVFGFLCVAVAANVMGRPLLNLQELIIAILLFGLGFWDDRASQSPRLRMILQVLIYTLGFTLNVHITLGAPVIVEFTVGLIVFVAIPLPVTGAWTGTLAAWLFGVNKRVAFPAIFAGICIAGVIVTLASLGVISIWGVATH